MLDLPTYSKLVTAFTLYTCRGVGREIYHIGSGAHLGGRGDVEGGRGQRLHGNQDTVGFGADRPSGQSLRMVAIRSKHLVGPRVPGLRPPRVRRSLRRRGVPFSLAPGPAGRAVQQVGDGPGAGGGPAM